jgi:hypothetical protein
MKTNVVYGRNRYFYVLIWNIALIPTGTITRGHNIRFLQPHTRTITMQYSFFPSAIRTWNTPPQQLASMTSLEGFRQALANK